jgi:PAS domain S-box-containing protein
MMQIRCQGRLSSEVLAALGRGGFLPTADAALALVDWGSASAQVASLSAEGVAVVALVSGSAEQEQARARGAVSALLPPWTSEGMRELLEPLARAQALWERRSGRRPNLPEDPQSTRDLLARLIDATPDPVMAADPRGRVLVFNRAAEQALGYEAAWVRESMNVADIYAEHGTARRVLAEIRNSPNGICRGLEVNLRSRGGQPIPVRLTAAEVYAADSRPVATVGVFQDQRPEQSLEQRLRSTTGQLMEAEGRLQALDLVAATTHEINQPLTAAMGLLEITLLRADLPEDVQRRVERSYQQLERIAATVKRLGKSSRGAGAAGRQA